MEKLNTVVCSTGHFTLNDNKLLNKLALDLNDDGYGNYIHDYEQGYILRLYAVRNAVLDLKKSGISKDLRKFIIALMRGEAVNILIFDRDADYIEGFEIFDW